MYKTTYIKDLKKAEHIVGNERLLIQDDESTKQVPLGVVVDKVVEKATAGVTEAINEFNTTANQQITDNQQQIDTFVNDAQTRVDEALDEVQNIDDRFAQTNAQLSQMNINKADKSQIGSPLTANSVAEMTDISKVYVNLSDGHWYSYNGLNWVDGGIYNSVAIGDKSVFLNHIKGGYGVSNLYNYEINFVENQFINTAGVIERSSNCGYAKVPIPQNQKISIYKPNATYSSSGGLGLFLGSSEEIISSFTLSDFIQGNYNGTKYVTVDSPVGCCYVCFNVKLPYYDDSTTTIVELGDKITNSNTMTDLFGYSLSDVRFNEFKESINYHGANLYDKKIHYLDNFYIGVDGEMTPFTGWGCAIIPCEPNTTYSLQLPFNDYSETIGALGYYNKESKIDYVCPTSNLINGNSDGVNYITFTTPSNCNNVRITCKRLDRFDNSDSLIFAQGVEILSKERYVKYIQSIGGFEISDKKMRDLYNTITYYSLNLYEKDSHFMPDYYVDTQGAIGKATGWGCAIIPCEPNTTYSLQLPFNDYSGTIGALGYYQGDSKIDYVYKVSQLINGTFKGADFITFTTPQNCDNVRITCKRLDAFDNSESLIMVVGESIPNNFSYEKFIESFNGYKFNTGTTETHPLYGKKWAVVGDSLTEKNIRATKNYHDYVAEETGVIVYNMGRSGTGYKRTEENNTAFYQRITSIPKDTEIVTIFGSGNDLSLPLGEVTDTGTDTLCGCINTTIDNLYSVLPVVKLGIITPCPWGGYPPHVKDNKMALYSDAIIEICKSRGVPCLDLYRSSNMRPWNATFKDLMYKRDDGGNVHPDEDGHKFMYRRFLSFIESL